MMTKSKSQKGKPKSKHQETKQQQKIENQIDLIWKQFGSETRRLQIEPEKADCLVPMLQAALQQQKENLNPTPIDEPIWTASLGPLVI
jgi:hypothetical protein